MAEKRALVFMIIYIARTCFAGDVSLDDVAITDPNVNSIRYSTTATTTLTVQFSLGQTGGGVAVTGVTSYFKNEAGSVMSNEVANAGSATAAADVTDIQDVEMPVIMDTDDGADCNEYLYLCFKLQYDAVDDDPSNDVSCLTLGKEDGEAGRTKCPDVALTNVTAESPPTSVTFSFTATLAQSDGGIDVSGINVHFANDALDKSSATYAATNANAAKTNETIEAEVTVTLPTASDDNCAAYTQMCFTIVVEFTEDTNHDNDQQCLAFGDEELDCDASAGVMVQHSVLVFIGSMLCVLLMKRD